MNPDQAAGFLLGVDAYLQGQRARPAWLGWGEFQWHCYVARQFVYEGLAEVDEKIPLMTAFVPVLVERMAVERSRKLRKLARERGESVGKATT